MDYKIREVENFTVIGMEMQITRYQNKNIEICKSFWYKFNAELKKKRISPRGNWLKYAFTLKKNDAYWYFCAIPKEQITPDNFIEKTIERQKYLVFEHCGSMDSIKDTINAIYKEFLLFSSFQVNAKDFVHFEKYDKRFHWKNKDSIIEIWLPLKEN